MLTPGTMVTSHWMGRVRILLLMLLPVAEEEEVAAAPLMGAQDDRRIRVAIVKSIQCLIV